MQRDEDVRLKRGENNEDDEDVKIESMKLQRIPNCCSFFAADSRCRMLMMMEGVIW